MPRKHPIQPAPQLKETLASTPSPDDPVYRALLLEESSAYSAWFFYIPAQPGETKEQLSVLRRRYEQKRGERLAYQPPAHPIQETSQETPAVAQQQTP